MGCRIRGTPTGYSSEFRKSLWPTRIEAEAASPRLARWRQETPRGEQKEPASDRQSRKSDSKDSVHRVYIYGPRLSPDWLGEHGGKDQSVESLPKLRHILNPKGSAPLPPHQFAAEE